jgi:hypothetical protein
LPDLRHPGPRPAQLADFELSLFDLLCQLDPADHDGGTAKGLQAQHGAKPVFYSPVVLLDEVIQVLTATDLHPFRQVPTLLQIRRCPIGCSVSIEGDFGGYGLIFHGFAQKGLGGIHVALSTQIEVHCLALLIHRAI